MKKLIFAAVITLMTMNLAHSQEGNFSIGINGGIPVGDVEEFATFNLGAEVAYRFAILEQFEAGAVVGYSHFFGDSGEEDGFEWEVEDFQFAPIAASARFNVNTFFLGADVGYAIGVNEDNEGGFYYKPLAGVNFGKIGVLASYSGISRDNFTVSTINLGIEYKL